MRPRGIDNDCLLNARFGGAIPDPRLSGDENRKIWYQLPYQASTVGFTASLSAILMPCGLADTRTANHGCKRFSPLTGASPQNKWGIPRNTFRHHFSLIQRDLVRTARKVFRPLPGLEIRRHYIPFRLQFIFLTGWRLSRLPTRLVQPTSNQRRSSKSPQKRSLQTRHSYRRGLRLRTTQAWPFILDLGGTW